MASHDALLTAITSVLERSSGKKLTSTDSNDLQAFLTDVVEVRYDNTSTPESTDDMELGILRFKDHIFYSIKLQNVTRNRLAAMGSIGAGVPALAGIFATPLTGWPGLWALALILILLISRASPLMTSITLDEACVLDMAWRLSQREKNFRLVHYAALKQAIPTVEKTYSNSGFNEAKLANALRKLESIGAVQAVTEDLYQIFENIRSSGAIEIAIAEDDQSAPVRA